MTASFLNSSPGLPVSGSLGQPSSFRKSGQHVSLHQASRDSRDQSLLGHLRNCRADLFSNFSF